LLTKYPDHELASNAQYWLGESYYGKKDYTKAAVAFATGYEKYKDGNKGADNILKLGMSMQMLGKKEEACTAFNNLAKEFPKASEVLKDKAAKLSTELNCSK
jgi:tol-pal system protein YbgF